MGKINIDENLSGLSGNDELEKAVIKMQKQLNWALSNIDSDNTSETLASGSFISADSKCVVVKNGLVTEII